jgi:hypothetical protein
MNFEEIIEKIDYEIKVCEQVINKTTQQYSLDAYTAAYEIRQEHAAMDDLNTLKQLILKWDEKEDIEKYLNQPAELYMFNSLLEVYNFVMRE